MLRRTAILILGFRRPDFLFDRLSEIEKISDVEVFVSVDFNNDEFHRRKINSLEQEFPKNHWIFRESNLGLAKHLFTAVTEVMNSFDNCIVIEDDVSASEQTIKSLIKMLERRLPADILTVGLFGGLPNLGLLRLPIENRWRETPYFSAWLWAIQREDWEGFSLDLVRTSLSERKSLLESKLGRRRVGVWSSRLEKVKLNPEFTWDYQMFYYGLLKGKKHLLPVIRSSDNLGLGDHRASNTSDKRPTWYFGKRRNSPINCNSRVRNRLLLWTLSKIDSFTWAGDSPLLRNLRKIRGYFS